MNTLKALVMTGAAFAFAAGQSAAAAPAPPSAKLWNGMWHLDTAKSKFGSTDTTEKSEVRKVAVAGNHVTVRSTVVYASGKSIHWGYSAATDGKWYLTSGNPANDHISLTAVSDREMTSKTVKLKKPAGGATISVSGDGKELTIDRTTVEKSGDVHDVLVFDRGK